MNQSFGLLSRISSFPQKTCIGYVYWHVFCQAFQHMCFREGDVLVCVATGSVNVCLVNVSIDSQKVCLAVLGL